MSKPTLGQLLGDPGHTPKSAAEDAAEFAKIAARMPERIQSTHELRQILAAEQSADALEGIRQDLTALLNVLGQISTTLGHIAQKLK
jgi:hypothetical protein